MKRFLTIFLLLSCIACTTNAQQKKSSTVVGFSTQVIAPVLRLNTSIPKFKLGIPTFSYSTSLENRFTLKNKLSFSFLYSLNYTQFNFQPANQLGNCVNPTVNSSFKVKEFSASLGAATLYQLHKDASLVIGATVSKPVSNLMSKTKLQNEAASSTNTYTYKSSNRFNPNFMIGFENSMKIFSKSLYYSLQYNLGFMPHRMIFEQNSLQTQQDMYLQGVQIGLKYKY